PQRAAISAGDSEVAEARRIAQAASDTFSRRFHETAFEASAVQNLGVKLPSDWTGQVQIKGAVARDGQVEWAENAGVEPEFYGVYARKEDSTFQWLADYPTEQQAQDMADRLAVIDAYSLANEYEQAARLARIAEERVVRDPNSTDEDRAAAREVRDAAEAAAAINDDELQQRVAQFEREDAQQAATVPTVTAAQASKTYIEVPFKEKDEAKELGARWDRQVQSWYVPAGTDAAPFAKWAQGAATAAAEGQGEDQGAKSQAGQQKPSQDRQYLAVPYGEHQAAKAAGALWDKGAKSWYAGPKADAAALARWQPENVPVQQGPAMTPEQEFADALKTMKCVVSGEHPIMDGKKHRITVEGEKHSENSGSGFYVGHLDGHPAGYIRNNKTGVEMKWKSKGYSLNPEEKAVMQAEAATKLAAREATQQRDQEQAAQRVGKQMAELVPVTTPTPYLQAKGVEPQAGVFTDREGKKTYIPATDENGKQWTTQYIQEDGTKRFAKSSRKEGCFHAIGGLDAIAAAPALVIGEGYATAASVSQALGYATVAA
ncbi:MAG TPA: DUF5710 domain-containing protein, partial [Rhodanobacter sp.]|nr:DUF5710 domain-containing protein [Rhodanobacter sp.]